MQDVSSLESGCDYALFKTGIRPMWEDQANKDGGRWLLTLERTQRLRWIDQIWLEIMLYLIGSDHNDSSTGACINGAVVNIRNKADKIAMWLSIADKSQGHGPQILAAGTELKARMAIPKHFPIHFETHTNVASRRGSTMKSEFTL
jgi:translation initiation factor 4E